MDVTYNSNLNYQGLRFHLNDAMQKLREYTKKHTFMVHNYTRQDEPIANKYEHILFHNIGITGHILATTRKRMPFPELAGKELLANSKQIDFIDIRLVSDVTPTLELEERLNSLVHQYRINR